MAKRNSMLGRSLLSMLLAGFLSEAQAADFTFNVPVELHDVHPDITHVRVVCNVTSTPTWTNNPFVKVAFGASIQQSIVGGEFNSTITVPTNVWPGKDPASGRSYRCDMNFKISGTWKLPVSDPNYPPDSTQPLKITNSGTL
jgi:hypothetical protein